MKSLNLQPATKMLLCAFVLFLANSPIASAGGWSFSESYFSHSRPVKAVALRPGPQYYGPHGEYVNMGTRRLRSRITVRGTTSDHLNIVEGWIQYGGQNYRVHGQR